MAQKRSSAAATSLAAAACLAAAAALAVATTASAGEGLRLVRCAAAPWAAASAAYTTSSAEGACGGGLRLVHRSAPSLAAAAALAFATTSSAGDRWVCPEGVCPEGVRPPLTLCSGDGLPLVNCSNACAVAPRGHECAVCIRLEVGSAGGPSGRRIS